MPEIKSIETIYYVIAFIVPGLIALFVRGQFIPGRIQPNSEAILYYLVMTVIYYGVAFPIVEYAISLEKPEWLRVLVWLAVVVAGPAIFGAILGCIAAFGPIRWLMRKLGVNVAHPTPTAWDWWLSRMTEHWVIVTLKDDTIFVGYCGEKSFFSSDFAERDAFIEKVYEISEDGTWNDTGDKSLLVGSNEIRTIEFIPISRED